MLHAMYTHTHTRTPLMWAFRGTMRSAFYVLFRFKKKNDKSLLNTKNNIYNKISRLIVPCGEIWRRLAGHTNTEFPPINGF